MNVALEFCHQYTSSYLSVLLAAHTHGKSLLQRWSKHSLCQGRVNGECAVVSAVEQPDRITVVKQRNLVRVEKERGRKGSSARAYENVRDARCLQSLPVWRLVAERLGTYEIAQPVMCTAGRQGVRCRPGSAGPMSVLPRPAAPRGPHRSPALPEAGRPTATRKDWPARMHRGGG